MPFNLATCLLCYRRDAASPRRPRRRQWWWPAAAARCTAPSKTWATLSWGRSQLELRETENVRGRVDLDDDGPNFYRKSKTLEMACPFSNITPELTVPRQAKWGVLCVQTQNRPVLQNRTGSAVHEKTARFIRFFPVRLRGRSLSWIEPSRSLVPVFSGSTAGPVRFFYYAGDTGFHPAWGTEAVWTVTAVISPPISFFFDIAPSFFLIMD